MALPVLYLYVLWSSRHVPLNGMLAAWMFNLGYPRRVVSTQLQFLPFFMLSLFISFPYKKYRRIVMMDVNVIFYRARQKSVSWVA